jgi:hypothetical protein
MEPGIKEDLAAFQNAMGNTLELADAVTSVEFS